MKSSSSLIFLVGLLSHGILFAQGNVGIGTNAPDASAILDLSSNSKGLLIPRLTSGQKTGLTQPAKGLLVYQTDSPQGFYYNKGTPASPSWILLGSVNEDRIAFSAYNVGNGWVEVFNASEVLIPFYQEDYDLGNNFVTAGSLVTPNTFVAPKAGIYHFEASITWADWEMSLEHDVTLGFKVNGTAFHTTSQQAVKLGQSFTMPISIDMKLQSGDQVTLHAAQYSGHVQHISRYENRYFGRLVMSN